MRPGHRNPGGPAALILVLAGVLALSACAGSSAKGASAAAVATATTVSGDWDPTKRPDPCRLLSAREVAVQFGHPVGRGQRLHGWPPSCQFTLDARTGQQLNVAEDSGPDARANFQRRKRIARPLVPVAGVGQDAYWLPEEAILHALSGSTRIYIAFRSGVSLPPAARSHATALARIALRRALQPLPMHR
jgi:hypothetical protein